jgi:hypothetical protein
VPRSYFGSVRAARSRVFAAEPLHPRRSALVCLDVDQWSVKKGPLPNNPQGALSAVDPGAGSATIEPWRFNKRKMEDQRRQVAEKEAASRRATKGG